MWSFAISLFLVSIYPESLLLPAVFGFAVQLAVVVFATLVGDWVDRFSRLTVVFWSLFIQNCLVSLCSVVLALAFSFDEVSVCGGNPLYFSLTVVGVVILGSAGNLATLANTISIERDWIVAIAENNKSTLSVLNANMRRIDLCCKLLAPTLTGVILSTTSNFICTLFVAGWNVVSFFVEFGLIYIIYRLLPQLKVKKLRSSKDKSKQGNKDKEGDCSREAGEGQDEGEQENPLDRSDASEDVTIQAPKSQFSVCCKRVLTILKKVFPPVFTLVEGWRIYKRQSVAIVGLSMASLYLTVLGFSGVTSAYFQTQRVDQALIGLSQGIGAIIGIIGTFFFQPIRERIGTVRAGLVGISLELFVLSLFTFPSVFIPGYSIPPCNGSYFAPYCPALPQDNVSDFLTPESGVSPTPVALLSSALSQPYPSPKPSATPIPSKVPTPSSSDVSVSTLHVALMLIGVLGARFGLWMFDLAVSQLIQENVVEEERGVFSGVMNVFISFMDMMHYVLVIVAPRPEHFRWLALVSIAMVTLGYILYAIYVRRVRGHLLHCRELFAKCCRQEGVVGYHQLSRVEDEHVVKNMTALGEPEDENL